MQRIHSNLLSTGLWVALALGPAALYGSPAAAEDAPRATTDERMSEAGTKEVQRALASHHVYDGKIDGVWGPKSEQALRKFQSQNQLEVTGKVDEPTAKKLDIEIDRVPVKGSDAPRVQAAGGNSSDDANTSVQLRSLSTDQAKQMQQRLQLLGYYKGPIDGAVGDGTRSALHDFFQHQAALASQGMVSNASISLFGTQPSDIQHRNGSDDQR